VKRFWKEGFDDVLLVPVERRVAGTRRLSCLEGVEFCGVMASCAAAFAVAGAVAIADVDLSLGEFEPGREAVGGSVSPGWFLISSVILLQGYA